MTRNSKKYRSIYREQKGPIPEGWHIHHIDGNKFNNHINNLFACSPEEHGLIHEIQGEWFYGIAGLKSWNKGKPAHNKGITQEAWNKGKKMDKESVEKMRKSKTGVPMSKNHKDKMPDAAKRGWETRRNNMKLQKERIV